jgi:DNA repair exonuclease SbcCD ATPase subunit
MSAQLEPQETTMADLVKYSITKAALAEMRTEIMALRVLSPDDEEGYARCKDKLRGLVKLRTSGDAERKALNKEALAFQRFVNSEWDSIASEIEPMESHLRANCAIVDDEKKRREEAAAIAARERLNKRIAALQAVKAEFNFDEVAAMPNEAYEEFLGFWQNEFVIDQKREAAEKARLEQLEAERLESAKLLEAERQRIRALEAEAQKMRQEALEREAAELKKQQAEAAEIAAKLKAERDAEEAKARAEKLATERAEIEAAAKIADAVMFEEIRTNYPTVEAAWVEIARLRKLLGGLATDMGRVLDGPVFNPLGNGGVHPAVRD